MDYGNFIKSAKKLLKLNKYGFLRLALGGKDRSLLILCFLFR